MTDEPENLGQALAWWVAHQQRIEDLKDAQDNFARPLEQAAHALLQAKRSYSRMGMYPSLREVDGDGSIWFSISNGIDYSDDYSAKFTIEELNADIEQVRIAEEDKQELEGKWPR